MKVGILGGGLAGLLLGYELSKRGYEVTILEKEERIGGLCKSIYVEGYTFDVGGSHIIFSKDKEILSRMISTIGKENLIRHYRNTKIYYHGKLIKYPFENGLYDLDPFDRYECLKGIVDAYISRETGKATFPRNFKEWCYFVFGKGIAEKYLIPYNEKIWKRPLEEISLEWVGGRVPNPPIDDIIKSAVGIPTEGYTHQLNFYYPIRGGIQSLPDAISKELFGRIINNFKIRRIKIEDEKYIVKGQNTEHLFDMVISTIPLPNILQILEGDTIPKELSKELIESLDYNSLITVSLGMPRDNILVKDVHWMYFPHEGIFHRIAFLHNYSPYMAPKGKGQILAEISINPKEVNKISPFYLVEVVKEDLEKLDILRSSKDVEVEHVHVWEFAYVVNNHEYSKTREKALSLLKSLGIESLGRFGSWRYLNMDHIFQQVQEFVNNEFDKSWQRLDRSIS